MLNIPFFSVNDLLIHVVLFLNKGVLMPSVDYFRFVVVERSNFDFILANLKPGLIDLIPNNASSIKKTK